MQEAAGRAHTRGQSGARGQVRGRLQAGLLRAPANAMRAPSKGSAGPSRDPLLNPLTDEILSSKVTTRQCAPALTPAAACHVRGQSQVRWCMGDPRARPPVLRPHCCRTVRPWSCAGRGTPKEEKTASSDDTLLLQSRAERQGGARAPTLL